MKKRTLEEAIEAASVVDYELRHIHTGEYAVEYPEVDRALQALHNLVAELDPNVSEAAPQRTIVELAPETIHALGEEFQPRLAMVLGDLEAWKWNNR